MLDYWGTNSAAMLVLDIPYISVNVIQLSMTLGEKLFEEIGNVTGFKVTKVHPIEGLTMEVSFTSEIKEVCRKDTFALRRRFESDDFLGIADLVLGVYGAAFFKASSSMSMKIT
jgi:hypothetical protein